MLNRNSDLDIKSNYSLEKSNTFGLDVASESFYIVKSLKDLRLSYIKNTGIDLSCFINTEISHLEISYSEVLNVEALRKFESLEYLEVYGLKKPEWLDGLKSIKNIIWEELIFKLIIKSNI